MKLDQYGNRLTRGEKSERAYQTRNNSWITTIIEEKIKRKARKINL